MWEELKQLRVKDKKLTKRSWFLKNLFCFGVLATVFTAGGVVACFANTPCARWALSIWVPTFVCSIVTVGVSSKLHSLSEQRRRINKKAIDGIVKVQFSCWGCIYSNRSTLLPCAIHPVTQPLYCKDKKME